MAYFIFLKNQENIRGSLYRIAENQNDLNNLNIDLSIYKIIEDSKSNFEAFKYGTKEVINYNDNTITYKDITPRLITDILYKNGNMNKSAKEQLNEIILQYKELIEKFLKYNSTHPLFNRWNSYYTQLNNLNLDTISFPLNKSLEQYFSDLGQPSYNILQLP
jgi:hypothetical protein